MEPGANFQELYVSTWKMEYTGSRGSEPVTQDPAECGSHSPAAKCTCCRAARWPLLTGQRARRNQEMGSSISRKIIPATSLLCHRSPPGRKAETSAGAVWIRVPRCCPGGGGWGRMLEEKRPRRADREARWGEGSMALSSAAMEMSAFTESTQE